MKKSMLLVMMMLIISTLQARYFMPKNDSQFVDEINKYEFSVVCFLPRQLSGKDVDRQLKKDSKLLQETVKATSETDPYRKLLKEEVGFLVVDASRENMQPLLTKYKLDDEQLPQFLLFRNGKALSNISGNLATLDGFVSKSDVLDFINDYFGKEFDDILAKKADEQAAQRELEIARYQAYAAYRYPYGAWAPYNPWGRATYTGYAAFNPYAMGYYGYDYTFFIP